MVIFDTFYSNRENIVASYITSIIDQLDFCKEFQIVTRNVYRGAKIKRPRVEVEHYSEIDRKALGSSIGRRLKSLLATLAFARESQDRWLSDIGPYRETVTRLLFDVSELHAVVIVSQSTSFVLAIARLCHLFSDNSIPHLVAVTPATSAAAQTMADLAWLGVRCLQDGEVAPHADEEGKDLSKSLASKGLITVALDKILEYIPGTQSHVLGKQRNDSSKDIDEEYEEIGEKKIEAGAANRRLTDTSEADSSNSAIAKALRFISRRSILAKDTVLFVRHDRAFFGNSAQFEVFARDLRKHDKLESKPKIYPKKELPGKSLPQVPVFTSPNPYSFFDEKSYPYRVNISRSKIDWLLVVGPGIPLPKRVRDIVLFIRPDWAYCGSGTYFESLARYFRNQDTLIVDIAIWPYKVRFSNKERRQKLHDEDLFIRAAASFFLRRTGSWARSVSAATKYLKFYPRSLTNQVLLSYGYVPKPALMDDVIANARITKIYLNHYFTYGFAENYIAGRKFFLDTHDIQAINAVHHLYRNNRTGRLDPFEILIDEEMKILRRAERVSFVSLSEVEIAKKYLDEKRLVNFIAVPNVTLLPPKEITKKVRLLFVASRNPANEQNIDWFLANVWPALLKRFRAVGLSDLTLDVCGNIKDYVGDIKPKGVRFLGMVDSLDQYYQSADLVILPVISGGGAAMKTIEALLYQRPIIGTKHAFRGLPQEIAEHMGYYDDPKALAEGILQVVKTSTSYKLQATKTKEAARMLRDQNYFSRLTESLEAVRCPKS